MTVEEYAAAQAALSAEFVAEALQLATQFQLPTLTEFDWLFFLRILFPIVQAFRQRSSEIGREFYDSQREDYFPDLPRNDAYLGEYHQEWFIEDMEPAREDFMEAFASDDAMSQVALRAVKNVENGGRKQIIRMTEVDPITVRWARVATGRETCEFCLMLVSRGPVYQSAKQAGLNLEDLDAHELFERNDNAAMQEMMRKFHPGCDCLVVPVFDKNDWPGRTQYLKALDVWKKYSKMVAQNPEMKIPQNGNQNVTGPRKWTPNEAIIAAIRRGLYNGDINMKQFAIAA